MRDKTREAMRLFLGGRCYTAEKLEKDYLAEVANYSNDRWEAPQRASRLAASVKRYKTSEMLYFCYHCLRSRSRFNPADCETFVQGIVRQNRKPVAGC